MRSGVLLGSVLCPVLFLLYINDIIKDTTTEIKLFADNCILHSKITNPLDHLRLQTAINQGSSRCKEWQTQINIDKTVAMTISKKKELNELPIQD